MYDKQIGGYRTIKVNLNLLFCFLVGHEDKITPIASARFMNEKIKNSVLTIIDGAGHLPILENPIVFNAVLKEFILSLLKIPNPHPI